MDRIDLKFKTNVAYTCREEKPKYVWSKYQEILHGKILDVGADECGLRNYLAPDTAYTGIGLGGTVDMEVDLEKDKIPFEANSFNCVLCLDVLEHLDNIHDVFDQLCNVTKEYLIVSLPNPYRSFFSTLHKGYYDTGRPMKFYNLPVDKPEDRHKWFFSIDEAESFISKRGKLNNMGIVHIDKEKKTTLKSKLLFVSLKLLLHRDINVYDIAHVGKIWFVLQKSAS